jgi:hydroxymethylpyrimidine kinase/phosphomethylpyrimidine kinase
MPTFQPSNLQPANLKVVLTIAGSDSSAGAGLQMDLKVFQACGVYGACAATALTAQNTRGVHRIHHVPPRFVAAQIDAVTRDLAVAAAKTGMLGRAQVVEAVAERVHRREIPNLVVDPVILAKDGTPLLAGRGLALLKQVLLPKALVVTPNVPEAEALSGIRITDADGLREAAQQIGNFGVRAVLIKGGHLPGEPTDTLFWDGEFIEFPGARLGKPEDVPVHGTGCIYSAALTARIALGDSLPDACRFAKGLVEEAIARAVKLGKGYWLVHGMKREE